MPTYAPVTVSVRLVPRESVTAIVAEMVANVMEVSVEVGSTVADGDAVVLLESMKMEIPVIAERGGVVRAIKVAPGDVVQEGDVLVELTN
jgi:biotin carboxyl carrier protein